MDEVAEEFEVLRQKLEAAHATVSSTEDAMAGRVRELLSLGESATSVQAILGLSGSEFNLLRRRPVGDSAGEQAEA